MVGMLLQFNWNYSNLFTIIQYKLDFLIVIKLCRFSKENKGEWKHDRNV